MLNSLGHGFLVPNRKEHFMHKHSLFFKSVPTCEEAANWIMATFDDIEDADLSFDGLVFYFYTAYSLNDRQRETILSTVAPISFLSEEL